MFFNLFKNHNQKLYPGYFLTGIFWVKKHLL
jgi:hypothetical protein